MTVGTWKQFLREHGANYIGGSLEQAGKLDVPSYRGTIVSMRVEEGRLHIVCRDLRPLKFNKEGVPVPDARKKPIAGPKTLSYYLLAGYSGPHRVGQDKFCSSGGDAVITLFPKPSR